ncbi:MAG: hypothetical protein IJ075_03940 [Lachnospiraceae bacterium]|nr:hypothetical protein [Lachnospiraceae bacterium]
MLEEEYQEREDKAVSKAKKEAKKDKRESAIKLMKIGLSADKVSECLSMPMKEVQALAAKI